MSNILEFSDVESSDFSIIKKPSLCQSICEAAIKATSRYKRDTVDMTFTTDMDEGFLLNADAKLVREVLIQLLKNAAKFTTTGCIELSCITKEREEEVVFAVRDTGPGVPLDKVEFIFERFKKLDDFSQGVGLGLSLCRALAHKMGGDVTYDSSYKGGSRFVFVVPKN